MKVFKAMVAVLAMASWSPAAAGDRADPGAGLPAGIVMIKDGAAKRFLTADGKSLYMFDDDVFARHGSFCENDCARIWPPLLVPEDVALEGDWAVVKRRYGDTQLTYKGSPLYTFAKDEGRGSTAGAKVDRWRLALVVPPPPPFEGPASVKMELQDGRYRLVDGKGQPLYTRRCSDSCGEGWRPYAAGMAVAGVGDWGVVRDGQGAQWTYDGRRVYTFSGDEEAAAAVGGVALTP